VGNKSVDNISGVLQQNPLWLYPFLFLMCDRGSQVILKKDPPMKDNRFILVLWLIIYFIILDSGCNMIYASESADWNSIAIRIHPDSSRSFILTDKRAAFFYGETGKIAEDAHQGFYVLEKKYLNDYLLSRSGAQLRRNSADSIQFFPDHLLRQYPENVRERIFLLDRLNCLVIEIQSDNEQPINFIPLLPARFGLSDHYPKKLENGDVFILNPDQNKPAPKNNQPRLAFAFSGDVKLENGFNDRLQLKDNYSEKEQPARFQLTTGSGLIFVIIGETDTEILELSTELQQNFEHYIKVRRQRITEMLDNCQLKSDQPEFDKAFQWALVSMDQLIMKQPGANQDVAGIFAGLPWFNNYWGRDTFIAFPGAVLTTGQFEAAREILLSFSQFQSRDPNSEYFGRIPNRVTIDEIIYNTADGTPWFIKSLWDYYQYTADIELLTQLFPVVKLSIEGALKHHVDKNYFLTHDDAETWMDARGPDGPWSPRGNRAVEIQALWFAQLIAAAEIAGVIGEYDIQKEWQPIAEKVKHNFSEQFFNRTTMSLYDHLNQDDSADEKIRPNQILALTVSPQPLLTPHQELGVLEQVTTKLTYGYGVASLWQGDEDFHPYHVAPAYYPKDEAYHNGVVWGWLAGPVITSLFRYGYRELAFQLLESESFQILHHGAAGSFSELLDAIPLSGELLPKISGTVSQAWSIAEFIRNVYQDMLGISLNNPKNTILFSPNLPEKLSQIKFKLPLPGSEIFIQILKKSDHCTKLSVHYVHGNRDWQFDAQYPLFDNSKMAFRVMLQPHTLREIHLFFGEQPQVLLDGKIIDWQWHEPDVKTENLPRLQFAEPALVENLNCFLPPPFPLLSGEQISRKNPDATQVVDSADPAFDDRGITGNYVYPQNAQFEDGIFDLTRFQLFEDESEYYFRLTLRNLVQPGWHPEYGFQLTFIAIAIHQPWQKGGEKMVPRNANYQLPTDYQYHRLLLIGGGLQIEDDRGEVVAAYRPSDVRFPLGNIGTKTIEFAIPKQYLGENAESWRLTIMVGGQDDHGGAGLGEFRNVGKTATEWHGGGGEKEVGNCNIYDFLQIDPSKQ